MPTNQPSLELQVRQMWLPILQSSMRGQPVASEIAKLDNLLEMAATSANDERYTDKTMIERDLFRAREVHLSNKEWVRENVARIDEWRSYWKERASAAEKLSTQLVQEGLKYALALHGAAAISFLNAIASDRSGPIRGPLMFGLLASSAGVVVVAIAHVVIVNHLAHKFSRIFGRITTGKGWLGVRVIERWNRHSGFRRVTNAIDMLIFSGIVWFAIYMLWFVHLIWS